MLGGAIQSGQAYQLIDGVVATTGKQVTKSIDQTSPQECLAVSRKSDGGTGDFVDESEIESGVIVQGHDQTSGRLAWW